MRGTELLNELINLSDDAVLINDVKFVFKGDEVVLDSSIGVEELCEKNNMPPTWYTKLNKVSGRPVLIINNINSITEDEQAKFIDIIKYKKTGIYDLPKNTLVLITSSSSAEYKINSNILSLVMHI